MIIEFHGSITMDVTTGRFKMYAQVGSYMAADVSVEMPTPPDGDRSSVPLELVDAVCEAMAVRLRKEVGK